jgi:hypothetical protein
MTCGQTELLREESPPSLERTAFFPNHSFEQKILNIFSFYIKGVRILIAPSRLHPHVPHDTI